MVKQILQDMISCSSSLTAGAVIFTSFSRGGNSIELRDTAAPKVGCHQRKCMSRFLQCKAHKKKLKIIEILGKILGIVGIYTILSYSIPKSGTL